MILAVVIELLNTELSCQHNGFIAIQIKRSAHSE